jgi:hypothetical protein
MFDETPLAPPRHALMQDPAFAQALRLCGQTPVRLPGGLTLLHRRIAGMHLCMLPRAAPPPDLKEQMRAVGLHRAPLILSPERASALPPCLRLRGTRTTAIWTILGTSEDRRRQLHPKWRNQLAKAETQGMRITHHRLPADPCSDVLRMAGIQARARGYSCWPAPLSAAFAAVAPEQTHLFRASLGGSEIAHMLFITHGQDATYHLGHTTDKGRSTGAHNLLMWHAAWHLAGCGIARIDLGLVNGETPGLDRFKLRTGAAPIRTGGTYLYWQPFARR